MPVRDWAYAILALVALQRLVELFVAERNTRALRARGAVEIGAGHYPLIVALHAAWLAATAWFVPDDVRISFTWLAIFLVLQAARVWVIDTLGPYWTTRIITIPDAPLVRKGPYRFVRHPNYLVVAGEIAALPLVFGEWRVACVFTLANAAILALRIRTEDRALAPRRSGAA
ncbi:MAG: isoprenylcysteine carboxylmethyltransferase family protein [Pseudomonadota bacterium]